MVLKLPTEEELKDMENIAIPEPTTLGKKMSFEILYIILFYK